jgi:hypothetical protein
MFQLLDVLARVVQIFVRQQPHFCQHSKHGLNPSTRSLRHCASHKIHQKRTDVDCLGQQRHRNGGSCSGMWHTASFLMWQYIQCLEPFTVFVPKGQVCLRFH